MKAAVALNHWSWRSALHHDETHLCISLPFVLSFIANIARKRPEPNRDKTTAASGVTFTLHDLRRTYITIAESLDIPHYALKRLLSHRSSADVTGGYIIINVDRLRGPVELISERILEMKESKG